MGYKLLHTRDMGHAVIIALKAINIKAELIGTLPSLHDIDIVINSEKDSIELRKKLQTLFEPDKVVNTSWDGIFYYGTIFGNIDVFFEKPPRSPIPC